MLIVNYLQSATFPDGENELAEISKKIIHKIQNLDSDDYFSKEDYETLWKIVNRRKPHLGKTNIIFQD